jgi:hypothetical protein
MQKTFFIFLFSGLIWGQDNNVSLEEVVVEDEAKQSLITEDQKNVVSQDLVEAIYNRISGARITSDYRGSKNLSIRGRQSFSTQSDTVIWDIDGLIFTSPPPMEVNQIAYVEVLKDLAATNKYGSQGGAGVIVIRTNVSENDRTSSRNLWNAPLPMTKAQRDSLRQARKQNRKAKKAKKNES